MTELTTRERAASILSGAKLRMLEAEHMTVVSAAEWYEQQAQLAVMRKAIESVLLVMNNSYGVAGWHQNDEIATWGEFTLESELAEALESDAGKAFAEQVQALERLYEAYKERMIAGEALEHLVYAEDVPCEHCGGKGFHHGFGEDGHDPDPCVVCGGDGLDHSASSGASAAWDAAEEQMDDAHAELEAMNSVSNQPGSA